MRKIFKLCCWLKTSNNVLIGILSRETKLSEEIKNRAMATKKMIYVTVGFYCAVCTIHSTIHSTNSLGVHIEILGGGALPPPEILGPPVPTPLRNG